MKMCFHFLMFLNKFVKHRHTHPTNIIPLFDLIKVVYLRHFIVVLHSNQQHTNYKQQQKLKKMVRTENETQNKIHEVSKQK